MKTCIIYDTKFGFTKECAQYLQTHITDSDLYTIDDNVPLQEYNKVLFGSFIFVGEVWKDSTQFLKKHKNQLLNKKLGLFISGLDKEDYLNALQTSLDPELFYHSKIIRPGGQIDLEQLSFFEKRKLKKRINITENTREFYPDKLQELIIL